MSNTLISILSGLGGMFGWGVSDFFASLSTEKIGHNKTLFWSQSAGLGFMLLVAVIFLPNFLSTIVLLPLIFVAAISYTVGYLYFYKAFEVGNISVVSIVINMNAVFTILVAFFLYGQRLHGIQIPAVLLILLGVMLVSIDFKDLTKASGSYLAAGTAEALIASVAFGAFYWPLSEYIVERSDWFAAAFLVKVFVLFFLFGQSLLQKEQLRIRKPHQKLPTIIAIIGILEAAAVIIVSYGLTIGDSILISPIASSVAIVTVSLALVFLKEKVSKFQAIGIIAAIIGIILTAF